MSADDQETTAQAPDSVDKKLVAAVIAGSVAKLSSSDDTAPAATDMDKRAELKAARAEARQLRVRLGLDPEDQSALDESVLLDEQLAAAQLETRTLRQRLWDEDAAANGATKDVSVDDSGAPLADESDDEISDQTTSKEADAEAEVTAPANLLSTPIDGRAPDDLTRIKGIGEKLQEQLNDRGIFYLDQIADFTETDQAWANKTLGFAGRVERDEWISQARDLLNTGSAEQEAGRNARLALLANAERIMTATDDPDTPGEMSTSETEAMHLIESGEFVAGESNKPKSLLDAAPSGSTDDLKLIKGVGLKLEGLLHNLGIYQFKQIAEFSASDIAWVDSKLQFRGRIIRDRWVDQSKRLALIPKDMKRASQSRPQSA